MTIYITGSHGRLVVETDTGRVDEMLSTYETDEYKNIDAVDIEEWLARYPFEQLTDGASYDILDFGYWTDMGDYEPPCEDWRRDIKEPLKLR